MDGPGGGGLDSARSDGDGWWQPRGKRKGRSWSPLLGDSNSPPRGGPRGSPTSPRGVGALDGPAERRRGNAFAVLGEGEEDDPTAPLTPSPGAAVTPSSDPRWAPGLSSLSPASSPGPRRTSRRSPSAAVSDFAYGTSDSVPGCGGRIARAMRHMKLVRGLGVLTSLRRKVGSRLVGIGHLAFRLYNSRRPRNVRSRSMA